MGCVIQMLTVKEVQYTHQCQSLLQHQECQVHFQVCYKRHDCANSQLHTAFDAGHEPQEMASIDEISAFLDTRYVSVPEAMWRVSEYKIHNQSHAVMCLTVHLDH